MVKRYERSHQGDVHTSKGFLDTYCNPRKKRVEQSLWNTWRIDPDKLTGEITPKQKESPNQQMPQEARRWSG